MHAAVEPMPVLQGPLLALAPTDSVFGAARLMAARHLGFVPVLDAPGAPDRAGDAAAAVRAKGHRRRRRLAALHGRWRGAAAAGG